MQCTPLPDARNLVSVVIPCFNHGRYLCEAIDSVIAQTHSEVQCIVIDDGSTDETRIVAQRYVIPGGKVEYVYQPNSGLSAARNRGLARVKGRYVQFLDADDILKPNKLQRQVEALAGKPWAIAVGDYEHLDEQLVRTVSEFSSPEFIMARALHDMALRWETHLIIPPHAFLFDARWFTEIGLRFDESLPNHEDWDCWMRIFEQDPEIVRVRELDTTYRIRSNSMSRNPEPMWLGFRKAIRSQLSRPETDRATRRLLRAKLRITDDEYGKSLRSRVRRRLLASRLFCQRVPWPIQRSLIDCLGPLKRRVDSEGVYW